MIRILLTHPPETRRKYFGARALTELRVHSDVRLHEDNDTLTPDALLEAARGVDVIIADRLTTAPAEVFMGLPALKALLRCAVDIRNIDVAAASTAGVLVTHASPGFVQSVVELALGYLIDLSRGISRITAAYHTGIGPPEAVMGRQLSGSTLGIIGYGSIGRALAPLAATLGMAVLISDPYVTVADERFRQVSFEDLLTGSDYVVCLAVATDATENLIGANALGRMKPSAFFINLSRGNLVDEAALAASLVEGRIAGAALDVGRGRDQMPSAELARLPNVIATPHIGGLTPPAIERQALDTVAQVAALLAGEMPPGAVNPDYWTRRL
jgi:D-3-phosphoglycerate dehydrogenase / 2-oxoglutarate reductase